MTTDDYLIWSHEHAAWWKAGGLGYTADIARSGVYSREEAIAIVRGATQDWTRPPNEIAVAIVDLPDEAQRLPALSSASSRWAALST